MDRQHEGVVISPLPRLMCVPHRMCRKIFVGTAFGNGVVWVTLKRKLGEQFVVHGDTAIDTGCLIAMG